MYSWKSFREDVLDLLIPCRDAGRALPLSISDRYV